MRINVTLDGSEEPIEYVGDWAVLSRDPVTRTLKLMRVTDLPDGGEKWEYRTVQDCGVLVEENAEIRAAQAGQRYGDGLTLVARVPMTVWSGRLNEAIRQGDHAFLARFLNDPDHAAFRTKTGRI